MNKDIYKMNLRKAVSDSIEIYGKELQEVLSDLYKYSTSQAIAKIESRGGKFHASDKFKKASRLVLNYLIQSEDSKIDINKGLLFLGSTGVGKTTILKSMKLYYRNLNKTILQFSEANGNKLGIDVVAKLRGSSGQFEHERVQWLDSHQFSLDRRYAKDLKSLDQVSKVSILFIDDIGRDEKLMNYGNTEDPINDVLTIRHSNFSLTHSTSNLRKEDFKDRYGQRMFSRMKEMFNMIVVVGQDQREANEVFIEI